MNNVESLKGLSDAALVTIHRMFSILFKKKKRKFFENQIFSFKDNFMENGTRFNIYIFVFFSSYFHIFFVFFKDFNSILR